MYNIFWEFSFTSLMFFVVIQIFRVNRIYSNCCGRQSWQVADAVSFNLPHEWAKFFCSMLSKIKRKAFLPLWVVKDLKGNSLVPVLTLSFPPCNGNIFFLWNLFFFVSDHPWCFCGSEFSKHPPLDKNYWQVWAIKCGFSWFP